MSRTLVLTAMLSVALASTSFAYEDPERAACQHDAAHFCKGMSEEWMVRDCLVAHKPRIHPRCRQVLTSHGY